MTPAMEDVPKGKRPRVEPSADLRQAGHGCYLMFVSLMDGGFTEDQAIRVIGSMLAAQGKGEGDA